MQNLFTNDRKEDKPALGFKDIFFLWRAWKIQWCNLKFKEPIVLETRNMSIAHRCLDHFIHLCHKVFGWTDIQMDGQGQIKTSMLK